MSNTHILRAVSRAAGLATVSGSAYLTYLYQTDQGTERAIQAYATLIPVILHYRLVEAQQNLLLKHTSDVSSSSSTWKTLDERYAEPTVQKLAELQGLYCKYGQTAAGFTNTFGQHWIQEFRKLEDRVPPRPFKTVVQTIEEETGKPCRETFEYVDPIPLGSASIGQVHRARLADTKRQVCVKVQYPEAGWLFQNDMHAIRAICTLLAPEQVVILEAVERQNGLELDYRIEADNLRTVFQNMQRHRLLPREVVVPQPIFSTKRMLVMEYIPGPKLTDGVRDYYRQWAEANGTTLETLEREAREKILQEGIPSRYSGPSSWQLGLYQHYLATTDALRNAGIHAYNTLIGPLFNNHKIPLQHTTSPPNTPRILDTLMRVHGYQLLADGVFNADPHGGNFLLLPDGRVGLIDYGSTKRFSRNERMAICLLYIALARKDERMLADMCQVGGYKSKYGRKDVLLKLLQFGYDSWGHDVTGGKNIQQFVDELKEKDPWEEVPDNFVMAQFMSIRLRSLALGMNHPIRCSDWWAPIAEDVLKQEGLPYESWDLEQLERYKPELSMQKHKFA